MWTYERDNEVHYNGEDESYWEYFIVSNEAGDEIARCDEEKDAQLIAATPALLEALQTLVFVIDNGTQMDVTIATDEAKVIAKALGETK